MLHLAHVLRGVQSEGAAVVPSLPSAWEALAFTEVVTDSREVVPDALFVALAGARTDGHNFLGDVASLGARGALVRAAVVAERGLELETHIQRPCVVVDVTQEANPLAILSQYNGILHKNIFLLIAVDDPLLALQRLARYHRNQYTLPMVAITGSVGKTSTKEVAAAVLRRRFCTLKNKRSFNSEVTLPVTLLQLTAEHEAAIVEMGMWMPGEIRLLADLARPHIGVVTNIGPSHLERMGSMEAIIRAKAELLEALPPDGVAVLNADDASVAAMASCTQARVLRYGMSPAADVWADAVESHGLSGVSFRAHAGGESVALRLPLPGAHNVSNALAAIAVGLELGVSWEEIQAGLQDETAHIRLRVVPVTHETLSYTILDDTYNASPMSSLAALNLLAECGVPEQRLAVLGDMLELGSWAEEGHRVVGRRVAAVAHHLVTVGPRARWIAEEARQCGMAEEAVTLIERSAEAVPVVKRLVQAGSYVLVKGSRGVEMDQIVAALTTGVQ